MPKSLLLMLLSFVFTGCSTGTYWNFPQGGTAQQFEQDKYACSRENQQQTSSAYVGPYGGTANSGTYVNMEMAHACLRARGYQQVQGK